MKTIFRWITRLIVLALAAFLIYLCYQPDVAALRKTNPTSTALMELRAKQAAEAQAAYEVKMLWKNLDEISPNLVHAILIAEDDTFYQHHGFDLNEIREAIRINWEKKRFAYGGSTITQQLARTLYLSPRKNLIRKAKEALLTMNLERTLKKDRILEIYLNVVEWGRGIYGAEAASQFYYEKPAAALTPDEAVALASILPSPRRWSPSSEKAFMARRRTKLLDRMRRAGYLQNESPASVNPFDAAFPEVDPNQSVDQIFQSTEPATDQKDPDAVQGDVHEPAPVYP